MWRLPRPATRLATISPTKSTRRQPGNILRRPMDVCLPLFLSFSLLFLSPSRLRNRRGGSQVIFCAVLWTSVCHSFSLSFLLSISRPLSLKTETEPARLRSRRRGSQVIIIWRCLMDVHRVPLLLSCGVLGLDS